ncbi:hypothetical protein V491_00295 [Pseudogymnoascus sp. VKM F-3775]|nr:hypothetical protein V491_00295 [Pseudogymnoascus sp. VKM F-3775]
MPHCRQPAPRSFTLLLGNVKVKMTDQSAPNGKIKQAAVENVELADALVKDGYSWTSPSSLKLYPIILLITLNQAMTGYDGSLMSSMNAMPAFHEYFNVGKQGSTVGFLFAIYTVGQIIGSLFAAPAADRLGRRFGMFLGSVFIIIGTIFEATAKDIGQFMGGRFLIGFGVTVGGTSGPIYVVEISPPSMRGLFGGLYYTIGYCVGALAASWTCYGTGKMSSDWSWLIPVIIQVIPATIICFTVWLIPESPRWQIANGQREKARCFLVKYHGNGNEDSAIVNLQMKEIEREAICNRELDNNRWWDYRPLFSTRDRCFRMYLLMLVSVLVKFVGGAVISYYLPVILDNIGIKSADEQLLINALNVVISFVASVVGCFFVDKFGRRNLYIWGAFLTGLCYIPINVIAALADGHVATGTGYCFIAFIFLYGIFFSFCWMPLQTLYPAEILPNDIRAQGFAFQGLVVGLASFINTYATPIALERIGWKTYTIFLIFHFVYLGMLWWSIVETKGRSLEELQEIFTDPHPVKKSLQKHKILLVAGQGVKDVDD